MVSCPTRGPTGHLELCASESLDIDVLIIVDSDEFFIYPPGNDPFLAWRDFSFNLHRAREDTPGHNVFSIPFEDEGKRTIKPRIWFNPGEMRYLGYSHSHYGNVKKEIEINLIKHYKDFGSTYCQPSRDVIPGVILAHSHNLRHNDYKKRDRSYRAFITRYEEIILTPRPGGIKTDPEEAYNLAS